MRLRHVPPDIAVLPPRHTRPGALAAPSDNTTQRALGVPVDRSGESGASGGMCESVGGGGRAGAEGGAVGAEGEGDDDCGAVYGYVDEIEGLGNGGV